MEQKKETEPQPNRRVAAVIYSPDLNYVLAGERGGKRELIWRDVEPGTEPIGAVEKLVKERLGLAITTRGFLGTTEFKSSDQGSINVSFIECLPRGSVAVRTEKYKEIYDNIDWVEITKAPNQNWAEEQREFMNRLAIGATGPRPSVN